MRTLSVRSWLSLVLASLALTGASLGAEDWTQWRGRDRLGIWHETGIIERFPSAGLKATWRVPINPGYSGPAVADGRVIVVDWREDPDSRTLEGTERVRALDEQTGSELWSHEWETSYQTLQARYAIGPRATPTVDDDRLYVVGATGRLLCLDVTSGEIVWETDYVEDYDTSVPAWGVAGAPLVDGDRLIAIVGGEPDALVVAWDKRTGQEGWRAVEVVGEMGYSQPIIYEAGGARQLIIWHPGALVSLNPETGAVYWDQPWEVGANMAIATPVKEGNYLLVSQFYNGSLMMRLNADRPVATELWRGSSRSELPHSTDGLHAVITTPVIAEDHIYGVGSYGELRGLDARTGTRLWDSGDMTAQERWGTAFMVKHRDRYFVNNGEGDLIIAQFTPEGYVEIDRTSLIEPTHEIGNSRAWIRTVNWSHPAYANQHIIHRNDNELIRVSLAASDY
jgi:outer membrane protein assembly factor BamB